MTPDVGSNKPPEGTRSYLCKKCTTYVTYAESEDLYDVMIAHQALCQGSKPPPAHKRLADVIPPEALLGNLASIDDLLDRDILITGMAWRDSSYKEDDTYLSLTVQVDGEVKVLNTGAARVIQAFKALDVGQLPVLATFEKIQLPNGRRVYRVR